MLRRTLLLSVVLVSLAFFIEGQQSRQSSRTRTSQIRKRVSKRKPIRPPVSSFVTDSDSRELIVRVLDVGQGDAVYIRNGSTRVIIDGGPDHTLFGRYLDSLRLNNSTIDVVILTHQHLDHYSGLQELFRTDRHIHVRYFFENKDPAPAVTLAHLRDSILSRMDRDSQIYRDTDKHGSAHHQRRSQRGQVLPHSASSPVFRRSSAAPAKRRSSTGAAASGCCRACSA